MTTLSSPIILPCIALVFFQWIDWTTAFAPPTLFLRLPPSTTHEPFNAVRMDHHQHYMALSPTEEDTTSSTKKNNPFAFLGNFFPKRNDIVTLDDETTVKRTELKRALLELCQQTESKVDGRTKREMIEEVMGELELVCPVADTASSPLLQKKWVLEWTTEKEINFFSDFGISGQITQSISSDNILESIIEFKRGGGLRVKGALSTSPQDSVGGDSSSPSGIRTYFEFTSATLDLDKWGTYTVPPLGKGWFDTLYLDEELRVDLNSRDDILICTPAQ